MLNSGYSYEEIAQMLILDDATIRRWYNRYISSGIQTLLEDNYIGGTSKLTEWQKQEFVNHFEHNKYLTVKEICVYMMRTYKASYTVKGMTSILHQMGFQ